MSSLLEGDVHSGGRQKQGRGGAPVGEVMRGRRALGRFVRRRFQADRTPAKALGSSLECLKKHKEEVTAVCQATVARPWVCATSGDSASPLNAAATKFAHRIDKRDGKKAGLGKRVLCSRTASVTTWLCDHDQIT